MVAFLLSFVFSVVVCPLASATSMWSKTYGGAGNDTGQGQTVQTSDGGYAISGDTNSSGAGGMDFWLIKTDASGNMQWNKTYGGALDESAKHMTQASDGGYAISGGTYSFGAGGQDAWLVKTDANGNMLWNKTYGGTGDDSGYGLVQTSDGGYAIVVITNSFGAGGYDTWLIKTDASGNMQWNQTYGGAQDDWGYYLIQSSDGGYAMEGYTRSFGGYKVYLVKADADGNMQWNKTYAISTLPNIGHYAIQTADGGYAIVGWTYISGQDQDFTLYKTDADGNLQWDMTYGGAEVENGYAVLQDSDGGYVLTGNTNSFGAGGTDIWLVKTDELGVVPEGLTLGIMILLSTVAVIAGASYFRKRQKSKVAVK